MTFLEVSNAKGHPPGPLYLPQRPVVTLFPVSCDVLEVASSIVLSALLDHASVQGRIELVVISTAYGRTVSDWRYKRQLTSTYR